MVVYTSSGFLGAEDGDFWAKHFIKILSINTTNANNTVG